MHSAGGSACQKSLAEFAARRRQRDFDHFLSGRTPGWSLLPLRGNSPPVPDRKYNSGCKCAICTPKAYKSCARQTAILLSKKGKALFRQSRILYVFLVFQTEEVGQKGGGDSQTQLCGVALNFRWFCPGRRVQYHPGRSGGCVLPTRPCRSRSGRTLPR